MLIFVRENEGKEIAGVDLTPGEFEALQKYAAAHKETLSACLCRIIEAVCAAGTARKPVRRLKGGAR